MPSRFKAAIKLVNAFNRMANFRAISSLINQVVEAPLQVSALPHGYNVLRQLDEELQKDLRRAKGEPAMVERLSGIVNQIRDTAEELIPEVTAITGEQPDLFSMPSGEEAPGEARMWAPPGEDPVAEPEQPMDEELEAALPSGFATEEDKWLAEPGALEPEEWEAGLARTAAKRKKKKDPTIIGLLNELVIACRKALSTPPQISQRLQKINKYFIDGSRGGTNDEGGLRWYDQMSELLSKYFGKENAVVFAKLLAATSPRMPVERNLKAAIRAFNYYAEVFKAKQRAPRGAEVSLGEDPNFRTRMGKFFMRTHANNEARAMMGEELSGPKVRNFANALSGDGNAVTLDVWMGRAIGLEEEGLFRSERSYEVVAEAIRELAQQAGVEPRQYQAAVWTGIKLEQSKKGQTAESFDALLEKQWDSFSRSCFRPRVKIPRTAPVPSKEPLFEGLTASWLSANCRFALVPGCDPPHLLKP